MIVKYGKISVFSDTGQQQELSGKVLLTSLSECGVQLRQAEASSAEGVGDYRGDAGYFLLKDDKFIEIQEGQENSVSASLEIDDESFYARKNGSVTSFFARAKGYTVVVDNVLTLFDPCRITSNRIHLFFLFQPVKKGREKLIDAFFDTFARSARVNNERVYTLEEIRNTVLSNQIYTITISRGTPPKPGRMESLDIKISSDKTPRVNREGITDLYLKSEYLEVSEGTVLAEKIIGIEGEAGIDAYGNDIPVVEWKEIPFTAGENVSEKQLDEGRIEYIAGQTGIVELNEDRIDVWDTLHVNGDVCVKTGSLDFSRDILVDGNVHSLFHIKCGGNLTVKGIIENGAIIECAGDFVAEKGILGEKTKIIVKGNVSTGYINEAYLRVLGDLTVSGTIYSASVFCAGFLTVESPKFKNKDKGCIVGGSITAMKGMRIHSAGSEAARTELVCGIDCELKSRIVKMEESIPPIKRKMLRMQYKVGIDFSKTDIIERLKELPDSQKEMIKSQLEAIKVFASQKKEIEEKIHQLEAIVLNPEIESLAIGIDSHILPDTIVIIGEKQIKIEQEMKSVEIRLVENEIVIREGVSESKT